MAVVGSVVTVADSATLVATGTGHIGNPKRVFVRSVTGAVDIDLGGSGVTFGAGYTLQANEQVGPIELGEGDDLYAIELGEGDDLYAIVSTGTEDLDVLEVT